MTKLHQDMSDAVNVMNFVQVSRAERARVGLPEESPEDAAIAASKKHVAGVGGSSSTDEGEGDDAAPKAANAKAEAAKAFAKTYLKAEAAWRKRMPRARCGDELPHAADPG